MEKFLIRRPSSTGSSRRQQAGPPRRNEEADNDNDYDNDRHKRRKSERSTSADSKSVLSGDDDESTLLLESDTDVLVPPDELEETLEDEKVLYRSSIYVDAFALALDTVLEQETHLFTERELSVFAAWRQLEYEAQYLYVRLFLRKSAAWHRIARLGYSSNIGDLKAAIKGLQLVQLAEGSEGGESFETPAKTVDKKDNGLAAFAPGWTFGESFAFAESLDGMDLPLPELVSLLSLDELRGVAKDMHIGSASKLKGKSDLQLAVLRAASTQTTLFATDSQEDKLLKKARALLGSCIRLCTPAFRLFERVHLVFFRTSEWTERSLTAAVLGKASRRVYPAYVVSRTGNVFGSRAQLVAYEAALLLQKQVDELMAEATRGEMEQVVSLFRCIEADWEVLLREAECVEDEFVRRLRAAHVLTRIAHYAAHCMGRLKQYTEELALLTTLLDQQILHPARRGAWYQRKALVEERYVKDRKTALATCVRGLQDPNCHVVYHYELQRRITRLERQLRVPRREQHDFGHLQLLRPEEHTVHGVQLESDSMRTVWAGDDSAHITVEEMCLADYRRQGWTGYHAEGGIVRTLFACLFYDVMFLPVANVFQTPFQTAPLDLWTDSFYGARASEINTRLVEISNGEASAIVERVYDAHCEQRTAVAGLLWDRFGRDDLVDLAACFRGDALALVCKIMAQEYRQRGGGMPDLVMWRTDTKEVLFSEVKSAADRLSATQRMWIHVLAGAGVRVAVCHAVAVNEVKEIGGIQES